MHSFVTENNETHTFPSCLDECDESQYTAFAKANLQWIKGEIDYQTLQVNLVYAFLNMKRKVKLEEATTEYLQVTENVLLLSQCIDSFYEEKTENRNRYKSIKQDCITNKIPFFKLGGKKYIGPETALTSLTYGQYIEANNAYQDYALSNDAKHLDLLVATLYLPENNDYNPKTLEARVRLFATLDQAIKYGIFLFFGACIKWISNQTALPLAGGNTANLSLLFQKTTTTTTQKGIGMLATLYELAETQVFGNIDDTARKNLYDVLVFLAHKKQESEKIKRDAKNRTA